MASTKPNTKCKTCKQFITDDILYRGDPDTLTISETVAMQIDKFCMYENHALVGDKEVPSFKVTSFAIYDQYNHLCAIDSGLIDKGVKLYFSGYMKTLDDEDPSINNGTLVSKVGPLTEWWIYGYDGGEKSVIGLTTEHAFYYLMKPSLCYETIFKRVLQRSRLSKLVIEFLLDFGCQNPTFEDLIQHLKGFNEFSEVEELLLREAQFLCEQILSYDENFPDEEVPMISYLCIQTLIQLTGVTLKRKKNNTVSQGAEEKERSVPREAVTTSLVKYIFERFCFEHIEHGSVNNQVKICKICNMTCEGSYKQIGLNHDICERCNYTFNSKNNLSSNEPDELGTKPIKHKECSKQILHSIKWLKKNTTKYNDYETYSSVCVDDFMIQQGDCVMLHAEDPNEPLRIATVCYMYDSPTDGAMFHAHFYCRGSDTILGNAANPRELFVVDDCDDYPVGCIVKKAQVEFRKTPENWSYLGGEINLLVEMEENGESYYFSKIYDYEFSKFRDYNEYHSLDSNLKCMSCRWQNAIKNYETPSYKDNCILWRKDVFKRGSTVFLEPGQTKHVIGSLAEDEKINIDDILHPELYRKKSDMIKGSNLDTPEPFTVGLIEDIKIQKNDIKIKVRMFYRPEDTKGSLLWTYIKDINYLYWTQDVTWTTFKNVTGKCYVTFTDDIELARKWSENGPFRFYYSEAYNHKSYAIYDVPAEARKYCSGFQDSKVVPKIKYELRSQKKIMPEKNFDELPLVWPQLDRPLRCLDIYAGCGALSEGLHRAGAANTLWAIDKEIAPAQAFQLNNPDCHVYIDDCNTILKTILEGKGNDLQLPDKGDVELLIGGPPCQGFSVMNRYNNGQYSYFNNSQIITFLSYCDYYRPKYIILENVRNFVSFKKGLMFKLTLKCLLAIGYQISFGILQAGNFGIPQTRRRFILMGAAPGCALPHLPEPLHVFRKYGSSLSIVIDGLSYDTGSHWTISLPYRTICVRDAIADLPEIENGCTKTEMPYDEEPKSHFQRRIRRMNKDGLVKDHICKELSPLVEARISHIPTYPGADWRDLPNKVLELKDGSVTSILKYQYRTKDQSKMNAPRGVCRCSTGSPCDPSDKQFNTLIPWCLSHTADRHNNWAAVYGRLEWDGYFGTTVTNPEPMSTQGRVLHPEQNRVVSVRECARSQGFSDEYKFCGNILDKHRQIGNAVPPPLALALGREIIKAHNS